MRRSLTVTLLGADVPNLPKEPIESARRDAMLRRQLNTPGSEPKIEAFVRRPGTRWRRRPGWEC